MLKWRSYRFIFDLPCSTARICNEDIVLNGIPFKKGAAIMIPIYCVQRDPEIWPDPETFDPERLEQSQYDSHICHARLTNMTLF